MSLTATYNGVTIDPVISWSESTSPVFGNKGRTVTGYQHVINVTGFFESTNATGRATDIDTTIYTKMREFGQDLIIKQDGTNIRTLNASECEGDGPWSSYDIPANNDLKVGFNTPFTLTVVGRTDPATAGGGGGTLSEFQTDTYNYDVQNRRRFTRRGKIMTDDMTSARSKFEATDPLSSLDSSTTEWQLIRKEETVDDDDRELNFFWEYLEAHEKNQLTASDYNYTIQSNIQNGVEVWVASGSLRFDHGQKITITDIKKMLKQNKAWPSKGNVTQEALTDAPRANTLSFTVRKELAYGDGGTLSYSERVSTETTQATRDFFSLNGGKNVRQLLHSPSLVVMQSGRWVREGSYPQAPEPILSANDPTSLIAVSVTQESPQVSIDGKEFGFAVSWSYEMRPLNELSAGEFANPYEPGDKRPLKDKKPGRQTKAK